MNKKNNIPSNPKRSSVQVAAIIPARGGQQSIPYKNLQILGGKTLLAWAVEVALAADKIDAVFVSTEDAKIMAAARKLGAITIPRPKQYSRPTSGDAGWYHHAMTWLTETKGWQPELLVNLRPTSPLRFAADIDAMVMFMINNPDVDGLKSVVPAPLHPYKMWVINNQDNQNNQQLVAVGSTGKLTPVFDCDFRQTHGPDQPRQLIQAKYPVYFQDGQIDITRRKFILRPECLRYDNVWGKNLYGYLLDSRTSTDLDTAEDFIRAEKIYRQLKQEQQNKKL